MSQHTAPPPGSPGSPGSPGGPPHGSGGPHGRPPSSHHENWVVGGVVFAGVLLLLNGILSVLQGVAAISENDVYARVGTYVYELDLTGWGVIHVVLGAVLILTGWGLLRDMAWARVVGIVLASLSLIAEFLFLPYAPVWSIVMMAIDVFVIWALASRHEHHA
ncbi:hypothetical protein [Streptomyces sp. AD55]|uniref:DUF7144 family membrane protein n=1 Tax=Streptomyces sp. AD55 TaxID=3242895 RepID=UPI003526D25D